MSQQFGRRAGIERPIAVEAARDLSWLKSWKVIGAGVFGLLLVIGAMGEKPKPAATMPAQPALPPIVTPGFDSFYIIVSTDPRANYQALDIKSMSGGIVHMITRRDGSSGTTYAKREIDCLQGRFRYLAEGDTLEALRKGTPGTMGRLTYGSISTILSERACGYVGLALKGVG